MIFDNSKRDTLTRFHDVPRAMAGDGSLRHGSHSRPDGSTPKLS